MNPHLIVTRVESFFPSESLIIYHILTLLSLSFPPENSHLNLFSTRPQPKKKRKSRTAFTNHQIFELEKRFLYQKYLSPADRDEIAGSLGLSNAQVSFAFGFGHGTLC